MFAKQIIRVPKRNHRWTNVAISCHKLSKTCESCRRVYSVSNFWFGDLCCSEVFVTVISNSSFAVADIFAILTVLNKKSETPPPRKRSSQPPATPTRLPSASVLLSPHCVKVHLPSNDTQRKHTRCANVLCPNAQNRCQIKLIERPNTTNYTIREQEHWRFHHTQYNQPATVRQTSICSLTFQFSFPNLKSTPPLAPFTCSLAPHFHLWTEVATTSHSRTLGHKSPLVRASKSLCVLLSQEWPMYLFSSEAVGKGASVRATRRKRWEEAVMGTFLMCDPIWWRCGVDGSLDTLSLSLPEQFEGCNCGEIC